MPSLLAGLRRRLGEPWPGGWRVAGAFAALLALGPALTMMGAGLIERQVRRDIAALQQRTAGRTAGVAAADAARAALTPLVARPGLAATIEALARVMPTDAALVAAERSADGALRIEIATPDPDRLRTALRRDPATRGLRDAGQRGGDGAIIVAFGDRP